MIKFIKSLDTKSLLALYNELTSKSTSKFASRDKGEGQVVGAAKAVGSEAVEKACKKLGIDFPSAQSAKAPAKVKAAKPAKAKATRVARGTNLAAPAGAPVACREGSKQAMLLDMLRTEGGVTMDELITALSGGSKPWTEATVRSGFGWDMKQKGYGVKSEFDEHGVERFFIVLPKDSEGKFFAVPPHRPLKGVPKADARQTRLDV